MLVLFSGLFIMISATAKTGYPEKMFEALLDSCKQNPMEECTVLFSVIIVFFSLILSKVPLILLIKGYIKNTLEPGLVSRKNWMLISWVSTLSGNFILLGSAANLIVADQAKQSGHDVVSTISHGKFGIPSTLACIGIGIPILLKTMV